MIKLYPVPSAVPSTEANELIKIVGTYERLVEMQNDVMETYEAIIKTQRETIEILKQMQEKKRRWF